MLSKDLESLKEAKNKVENELDIINQRRRDQIQKVKQQTREQHERERKERSSLTCILSDRRITGSIASFSELKDFIKLGVVNKRFSQILVHQQGSAAWKNLLIITRKQQQPQLVKQVQGSMQDRLIKRGSFSIFDMGGGMLDESKQSLLQKEKIHSDMLEVYNKDKHLEECIQRYVCDNKRITQAHFKSVETA